MTIRNLRVTKRVVAAVATAALCASVLALPSSPVGATQTVASTRTSGIDRYSTAALVALASSSANNPNIILVSGENYPDGLAAAGLSGHPAAA